MFNSSHNSTSFFSFSFSQFKAETQRLYNKYYPIEISHEISYDDKIPYMVEWWDGAHAALISQNISHGDIAHMVKETPIELREGLSELLILCRDKEVPLLVFSAGIRGECVDTNLTTHKIPCNFCSRPKQIPRPPFF